MNIKDLSDFLVFSLASVAKESKEPLKVSRANGEIFIQWPDIHRPTEVKMILKKVGVYVK